VSARMSAPEVEVAHLREALIKIIEALDAQGLDHSEAYLVAVAALATPGPRPCRCSVCGTSFRWPGELAEHLARVHGSWAAA
jgi:hypothetical protein